MDMKYYVIAGTKEQFDRFINFKSLELWSAGKTDVSLSHFVYVDSIDKLRGVRNPHGWFYGNWMNRDNIREIVKQLFISTDDKQTLEVLAKIALILQE